MSEKKEPSLENPQPKKIEVPLNNGILSDTKKKEELENRLSDTLRKLGSKMTRKEIIELASRIEVSKGLEGLKQELQKEFGKNNTELPDDILKEFLSLLEEVKEAAELGLKELKVELSRVNPTIDWKIPKDIHFSNRFPFVKRFEESELGKNIVIDIAGFLVGAVDSGIAIVKIFVELLKDLFKLPKDIYHHYKK